MKVKHFTELNVWQKADKLFIDLYLYSEKFPTKAGARTITDQILRSCGSISANIAEGFYTRTTKHYIHYLDTALNSAAETENWLYKIQGCGLISQEKLKPLMTICTEIEKMLQTMIRNLENR